MEIVDLILLSGLFAAGVGCGYYVRDLISRKRRERHLRAKRNVNIPRSDVERARRAFKTKRFERDADELGIAIERVRREREFRDIAEIGR